MVRVLGIDPDSTTTAWALVEDSNLTAVGVWRTKRAIATLTLRELLTQVERTLDVEKPDFVVVEGQSYHAGSPASPADIIKVAHIAAGVIGIVIARGLSSRVALPEPERWKGQVPKVIHQGRTFVSLGLAYDHGQEYCWPTDPAQVRKIRGGQEISRTGWKHVGDACGLALWGQVAVDSLRSSS